MKSSLRLKPKTSLEKDQVQKMSTILMNLLNQHESIDFREPVDWQSMELFDYPQIIKHPMDLGTIYRKFREKKYKYVESILNDIQMVWDNCKLYNSKASEIYQLADKLELNFRKMIKNYLPHLKISTVTSSPSQPVHEPPFEVIYMPDRGPAKLNTEIKKGFMEKLSILSQDELEKVINLIQKLAPKCIQEVDAEWGYIDLTNIDNSPFIALSNLVDETMKETNSRTKGSRYQPLGLERTRQYCQIP